MANEPTPFEPHHWLIVRRLECLRLANQRAADTDDVLSLADSYLTWLTKGSEPSIDTMADEVVERAREMLKHLEFDVLCDYSEGAAKVLTAAIEAYERGRANG